MLGPKFLTKTSDAPQNGLHFVIWNRWNGPGVVSQLNHSKTAKDKTTKGVGAGILPSRRISAFLRTAESVK